MAIGRKNLIWQIAWYVTVPIVILLSLSFSFLVVRQNRHMTMELKREAVAITELLMHTRQWILDQGGIYVKGETIRYIKQEGDKYLLIPPLVMQELAVYSQRGSKFKFRIISSRPLNTANLPQGELETRGLIALQDGAQEFFEYDTVDGKKVFRYMTPLFMKEECMGCHQNTDYKPGDVRGAISVILPTELVNTFVSKSRTTIMLINLGIVVSVVLLLTWFFRRRVIRPLKKLQLMAVKVGQGDLNARADIRSGDEFQQLAETFNEMTDKLKQYYQNLMQLTSTNAQLHLENLELSQIANSDGLTGLYNHRYFHHIFEQEIKRSKRTGEAFALAFIDVDNFKQFNDTYGHLIGDTVLRQAAKAISGAIRETDVATRYGGEEFAVIMPNTDLTNALLVAERVRGEVEAFPVEHEGDAFYVTVSVGIASYPQDGTDKDRIIDVADARLYQAKRAGKNRVCC